MVGGALTPTSIASCSFAGEKVNLEELKERIRSRKGRGEENQGQGDMSQMEMLSQMSAQLSPEDLQQLMGAMMR